MGLGALKKLGKGLQRAGSGLKELGAEVVEHPGRSARRFQRAFLFDEQQLVQAWKHPSPRSITEAALEVGQAAAIVVPGSAVALRGARAARMATKGFKASMAANEVRRAAGLYTASSARHVVASRSRYLSAAVLLGGAKRIRPKKRTFKEAASALQKAQRL